MDSKIQKALEVLKQKLQQINEMKSKFDLDALTQWRTEVLIVLDNLITEDSKYYHQFASVDYSPHVWTKETYKLRSEEKYINGLKEAESIIKAIIFGVESNLL